MVWCVSCRLWLGNLVMDQARLLLAKLNQSATYNNAHEMAAGSDVIFTDDVSLQVFFEHLQKAGCPNLRAGNRRD